MNRELRKQVCCDADLSGRDFSSVVLQGVLYMGARFVGSSLNSADLYWAIAMGCSFRDCDLTDTIFCGADLKEAIFSGARLVRTDFSRDNLGGATSLQGADLRDAIIQNCRFDGAQYDFKTKFPKGFYPDKFGLVFNEKA